VAHVLGLEAAGVVFRDEAGVEVAGHELRVRQQRRLEGDVARDAADHEAVEGVAHLAIASLRIGAVHDQLGDHRVVVHRDLAALAHAGVHAHAVQVLGVRGPHAGLRRLEAHQPAGGRQEAAERILGVDAALDRPAVALHVGLRERQLLAGGHADHQFHQVEAR
jgi:hypothetical protein